MTESPLTTACPSCDTLFTIPPLKIETVASCPRCGHVRTRHRHHAFQLSLAFSVSALLLLIVAATFPFLSFSASGRMTEMNLLDSALSLFAHGQTLLGTIVFAFMFAAPVALLCAQSAVVYWILTETRTSLLRPVARALHTLRTWNMIEVFLISVFVSAAKLASMANLSLGVAFFALVGFTVCTLISVAVLDRVQMWQRISRLST